MNTSRPSIRMIPSYCIRLPAPLRVMALHPLNNQRFLLWLHSIFTFGFYADYDTDKSNPFPDRGIG